MRGLWGRLAAMGVIVFGALALTVPLALADSRVPDNSTHVGPLRVRIYSQMCDGFGDKLHTRLNIANTSHSAQKVLVQDPFAKVVYDPTDVIQPGRGTLVHLTSSPQTPAHRATVHAAGSTATVSIAKSPCPPPTEPSTEPSTEPTTQPTVKPTVVPTVPFDPGGGPPIGGPGVVGAPGAAAAPASTGTVKAASSGTLPFTGSDIRAFALLGNIMVVIGFVMLLLSHRAKRNAALMKLTPATVTVEQPR